MIDSTYEELGPIDILVNNVGIGAIIPFLERTDDQWTRPLDMNLRSPWLRSQVYSRKLIADETLPALPLRLSMGRAASFFCCEHSSSITGQGLHAEGGWIGRQDCND